MADVTQILSAIDAGDPHAAAQLLPLVYDELRRLAAAQMAQEKPGHTLDATGLVHEAYLRLVASQERERLALEGAKPQAAWANRRHFFAAAAEAMRRILIDSARRKRSLKRGGDGKRFELSEADRIHVPDPDTLLTIDEALTKLATEDPQAAETARLRLFVGLTLQETAETLGISPAAAFRDWSFARAILALALRDDDHSPIS